MKNMQDFYKRLSSVSETSTLQQRRLVSLTRLNRAQLLSAASGLVWDIWHEAATPTFS